MFFWLLSVSMFVVVEAFSAVLSFFSKGIFRFYFYDSSVLVILMMLVRNFLLVLSELTLSVSLIDIAIALYILNC